MPNLGRILTRSGNVESWFSGKLEGLSDHQQFQAEIATRDQIGLLTGGPGVGKTEVATAILKEAARRWGSQQLRVCAPTGKAAVRITEAMQKRGLDFAAATIHRTLGVTKRDGGSWEFVHRPGNPLEAKLVCMDEASMLDTALAASLFSALAPGTLVLLVGDPGQLPPVSHGAVLRDLMAADLPQGHLIEIWRHEGDIVRACKAIRGGEQWHPSPKMNTEAGHNLLHFETRSPWHTQQKLKTLLESVPERLDRVRDCQVLCAVNDKSPLCRKELNEFLQGFLNPDGEGDKSHSYRVGDKVICLRNQFLRLIEHDLLIKDSEFVANGDTGQVTQVGPRKIHVMFGAPERHCYVGGDTLHNDFSLAYAITVHKSQGSQWPIVIYVSDEYRGARWVASRELIYTAISRAETLAVTIGQKVTIDHDCRREVLSKRKTFLAEALRGEI